MHHGADVKVSCDSPIYSVFVMGGIMDLASCRLPHWRFVMTTIDQSIVWSIQKGIVADGTGHIHGTIYKGLLTWRMEQVYL